MGAAPQKGRGGTRHDEQQVKQACKRRRGQREAHDAGDTSKEDDLGTEAMEKVRDSHSERAATRTRHIAAGHNKRRWSTDDAGHWNGWDHTRQIHEEEAGWYTADAHTMVRADGSEPHVAAQTAAMAHLAKRGEKHKQTDEDEGQRKERKRDDEEENTRVRETAQPGDDTRGEQSHATSHYYRNRDTI